MRAKVHSILIGTVTCAQLGLSGALLAAHPTHTLARDSRRLAMPTPAHSATHASAAHHPAASASAGRRHTATPAHRGAGAHPALPAGRAEAGARRRGARTVEVASHTTAERVHSWEQTRHEAPVEAAEPSTPAEALTGTVMLSSPELPHVPSIEQEASTPLILPSLYDKRGHLVMPAPLYGSHEILLHQNVMADHDGISRVRDDEDLLDLQRERKLVPLPEGETLRVDERLPLNRRFSRPWTAEFVAVLARDFYNRFHEPLQINSAVRTVDVQEHLMRTNGNAAPAEGDTASPHLTGQAVDIGKRGLTMPEIAWMRTYLEPLIEQGSIDVEEEFKQSCFHISVYRSYEQGSHLNLAATPALRPAAN